MSGDCSSPTRKQKDNVSHHRREKKKRRRQLADKKKKLRKLEAERERLSSKSDEFYKLAGANPEKCHEYLIKGNSLSVAMTSKEISETIKQIKGQDTMITSMMQN